MTTIDQVQATAFTVPTETPESDGTLAWGSTTMVLVEATAGGRTGLGYTYSDRGAATVVNEKLAPLVEKQDALQVERLWHKMLDDIRNLGPGGLAWHALSAVDLALWDLKARLYGQPLALVLGLVQERVPPYGSGGFTSFTEAELTRHMVHWVETGYRKVKLKVGREPAKDPARVRAVRRSIGDGIELFTDANGAYARKQALALGRIFHSESGVTWLEEPVSSEDLAGLRLIRDQGPPGLDIAAGEYGYDAAYFRDMVASGSVDVLQADVTRCGGYTGFRWADALCWAYGLPLSTHCAPSVSVPAGAASRRLRHLEFFYDHVRIEKMFFDGFPVVRDGLTGPDLGRPGNGLILKRQDVQKYAV